AEMGGPRRGAAQGMGGQALRTRRLTAGLTYVEIGQVDVSAAPKPRAVSRGADVELARSAEWRERAEAELAAAVERRRKAERARAEARRTEGKASEAVDSTGCAHSSIRALR
ncbi:MAG: hypothetical protein M3Q87_11635, partial [Actinomycetota bacterium]|nr:hypothetical protein [Actinomycetota bacterium]